MNLSVSVVTSCESRNIINTTSKDYRDKAVRLVRSIRKNGGLFKDIPVYTWYNTDFSPDIDTKNKLCESKAILVEGVNPNPKHPLYTKVQAMKDIAEIANTDFILWLDTDTFCVRALDGLNEYKDFDVVATPQTLAHHKWAALEELYKWKSLCSLFNLGINLIDKNRLQTQLDGKEGLFYLTSGVVLFRKATGFAEKYAEASQKILDSYIDLKLDIESFDQTALTLTALKESLNWKVLEEKFNSVYCLRKNIGADTIICHYQDDVPPEIEWNI